jgi:mannose-6-phosphate isomerase-like protein (cupin superfamily)
MGDGERAERPPVVLGPGDGRRYDMARIVAVFKADGAETAGGYSISEWWLEPHTTGPGAHNHAEDDVFYVLDGTMSVRVGDRWIDAPKGAFVLVPGGVIHDSRTAVTFARACSTSRTPASSSSTCPASSLGSPSIRRATPPRRLGNRM